MLTTRFLTRDLLSTLKKFYGRHRDLVNPYNVVVSRLKHLSDVFVTAGPWLGFLSPEQ